MGFRSEYRDSGSDGMVFEGSAALISNSGTGLGQATVRALSGRGSSGRLLDLERSKAADPANEVGAW